MDEFQKVHPSEDAQEAESRTVDDLGKGSVNDGNPETTPDKTESTQELVREKLEEKLDLDSVPETEPAVALPEGLEQATKDLVTEQSLEESSVSKDADSSLDQNGVSQIITSTPESKVTEQASGEENGVSFVVSKGTEETMLSASEEPPVESSGAADLVSREGTDADKCGDENSNMSETPPGSTENQTFTAVTPHPLQRTSWRGCCGLFEALRRSDR